MRKKMKAKVKNRLLAMIAIVSLVLPVVPVGEKTVLAETEPGNEAVTTIHMENHENTELFVFNDGVYDSAGKKNLLYSCDKPIVFTGTATTSRIDLMDPDVDITLKDLDLTYGSSCVLIHTIDSTVKGSIESGKDTIKLKIEGNVSLHSTGSSTLNTYGLSSGISMVDVEMLGVSDTEELPTMKVQCDNSSKYSLGVNSHVKNLSLNVVGVINGDIYVYDKSEVETNGSIKLGKIYRVNSEGELIEDAELDFRVLINGREYQCKKTDDCWYLLLPASEKIYISDATYKFDGKQWIVNGNDSGAVKCDLSADNIKLTIKNKAKDEEFSQQLKVMFGSEKVPAVYATVTDPEISFKDVNADAKHETKAAGIVSTFNGGDFPKEQLISNSEMQIKGRGNVSWTRAKKSYQIKLSSAFPAFGMRSAKKWILLPASADLSMLRNAVAFELAKRLEMEHYIRYQYTDLYVDGEYLGLYIMCEKDEIAKNRLEADVSFEFDNYYDNTSVQFTTKYQKCLVTLKSEPEDAVLEEAKTLIDEAENAIYNGTDEDVAKYVDIASFAKIWLMKDYLAEQDAINNLHFYVKEGKVYAGAAWDYDCSMSRDSQGIGSANGDMIQETAATATPANGTRANARWLAALLKHKNFLQKVYDVVQEKKDLFTTTETLAEDRVTKVKSSPLSLFAEEMRDVIADSSKMDTVRWSGIAGFHQSSGVPVNFTDEHRLKSCNVVRDYLILRNPYLEKRMKTFIKKATATPVPAKTPAPTVAPTAAPTAAPTVAPTQEPVADGPDASPGAVNPGTSQGRENPVQAGSQTEVNGSKKVSKPKGLKLSKSAKGYVKVSWKKVKNATGYLIYRAEKSGKKYKKIATIKKGSIVSYKDKKVKKGKTYFYKMKAVRRTIKSSYSVEKKIKVKE